MRARTMVLLLVLLATAVARADGPVLRRDLVTDASAIGACGFDTAGSIDVDAQGNVHVSRKCNGIVSAFSFDAGLDYLMGSPSLGGSVVNRAILRDDATGNVAVATQDDLAVVLLDPLGQLIWRAPTFPGVNVGNDGGGMVRLPSGDYVIVGDYFDTAWRFDAARVSGATGQVLWTHVGNGISNAGVAVDPNGDVVVAGINGATSTVQLTRLAASTGAEMLSVSLPGFVCSSYALVWDGQGLAIDAGGDVYVVGEAQTVVPGPWDAMVARFDASFAPVWCQGYDAGGGTGNELWQDIEVAGNGDIALAGHHTDGGVHDAFTGLLDPNGSARWLRTYDSGASLVDDLESVAFAPGGSVVSGGIAYRASGSDLVLLRYDAAGTLVDSRLHANPDQKANGVALDASGAIYVAGASADRGTVTKMTAAGVPVWQQQLPSTGTALRRVKVDGAGDVYAVGSFTAPDRWYVEKRSPSGGLLWEKGGAYPGAATDLDFTSGGNVVVVGAGGRIVEYTPAGAEVRSGVVPGINTEPSLLVHASGEITVGSPGLRHLSATFGVLWSNGPYVLSSETLTKLDLDSAGDIYASFSRAGGGSTLHVGRFSAADGAIVWLRTLPSQGGDDALSLVVEPGDHVLVVGKYDGTDHVLRYHRSGTLVDERTFLFPGRGGPPPSDFADVALAAGGTQAVMVGTFADLSRGWAYVVGWQLDPLGATGPRRLTTGEGPGTGNGNTVRTFDASGSAAGSFVAYGAGAFGTNVATGQIASDAVEEHLTGPGPGDVFGPQVRGFTGSGTGMGKVNFYAYGTLKFGVNVVSTALDADAFEEIATGAGPGDVFGPQYRGWNFDGSLLAPVQKVNFFAYGTLRFGVNPAAGDVDGDGFHELLTTPGPSVSFGPQVRGFNYDGVTVTSIAKINFNAFPSGFYGANGAATDLEADGFDELLVAPGPGSNLRADVATFDYDATGIVAKGSVIRFDAATLYGGNVAGGDLDGNGSGELVTGVGDDPAGAQRVRAFRYILGAYLAVPDCDFAASPGQYGVNVALGALE